MDRPECVRPCRERARPHIIKAVGFDFDHTLGIDNKLERVAFLRLLEPAAPLIDEIERIDILLANQRAGAFSIEEAVIRFVTERGASDPQPYVARYKAMCVDMVQSFVVPEPGVQELLDTLRSRNVAYALLSNGWSPLQQTKAARVGFDGPVLVSSDIGAQKPSQAAFAALQRAFEVPAGEIAYVGDAPDTDVDGARRAGLRGVWFDAERRDYPKELLQPSAVVHGLVEVTALVM